MTAATDHFSRIVQRSQEATATAVRAWADTLHEVSESIATENPLPRAADVQGAVDVWFDLADRLLAEQRAVVRSLVDAGAALGEHARAAATNVRPRPGPETT